MKIQITDIRMVLNGGWNSYAIVIEGTHLYKKTEESFKLSFPTHNSELWDFHKRDTKKLLNYIGGKAIVKAKILNTL